MSDIIIIKNSNDVLDDGAPKSPVANQLLHGEMAINYASGVETLFIKNSDDEIIGMPINGLMQTIAESLAMHEARNDNPHGVTKAQVGLGNVDNTPDVDKPISNAQQIELDKKLNNADNGGVANNLTTNSSEIALSAAQGIVLQNMISEMTDGAIDDLQELEARVASVEQEINESISYIDDVLMPEAQKLNDELTL